jgi:uncharacterized protein (DUF58 family)
MHSHRSSAQAADRVGRRLPRWPRLRARAPHVPRQPDLTTDPVADTQHRRVYILPTKAGLGYALILLATLLGALNYQNNLGLLLTFLMISTALVSMHHCWFQLLGLRVQARDGAPVFAGDTARFPVVVREVADKPRPQLALRGAPPFALPASGEVQLELGRPTRRRGPLRLDQVVLETRYPFGLFRAWTHLQPWAQVLVYPKPAARAPQPSMVAHLDQQARGDLGSGAEDFVGPRAYRPGDSPRQLDWKAYARERGLVVKQFGGDQSARVWLDWDAVPRPDPEQRLSLLARQVLDADALGCSYGLRLPGVRLSPARGGQHKHRCLAALAGCAVGGDGTGTS